MSDVVVATDDLFALYAGLELEPAELTRYGVIADLLEERGYADLPHAYRWCVARRVWPHRRDYYSAGRFGTGSRRRAPAKHRWAWYSSSRAGYATEYALPLSKPEHHTLSAMLVTGDQRVFALHAAAVQHLADRLRALRDVFD
ncbi:MAG: hypothetical protein K2V38_05495, partial [Gemmataceae bacterium]|nr:hypothetical protein [Gemmataceae bacterium]